MRRNFRKKKRDERDSSSSGDDVGCWCGSVLRVQLLAVVCCCVCDGIALVAMCDGSVGAPCLPGRRRRVCGGPTVVVGSVKEATEPVFGASRSRGASPASRCR
jgi:hypothetical protein